MFHYSPYHFKISHLYRIIFFTLVLFTVSTGTNAQSITPIVLNISGTTHMQNGYSMTFSVGESASIKDYISPNGFKLSSGFIQGLQPIVTGIEEVLEQFGKDEITVMPNPVNNYTFLHSNISNGGQIQYQIFEIGSNLIYRSPSFSTYGNYSNKIDFTNYPTGQYYIQVFFKPFFGRVKTGIFKIIKL